MKVVIIVTIPINGNKDDVITPTSCPVFTTTNDNSPLAMAIPSPVRNAVMLLYFALINIPVTMNNFDTNDVRIKINAGRINDPMVEISIKIPTDIKKTAENKSLNGMVITLAREELFDSATNTPAKNAPVAVDNPNN